MRVEAGVKEIDSTVVEVTITMTVAEMKQLMHKALKDANGSAPYQLFWALRNVLDKVQKRFEETTQVFPNA